ncbi:MAG: hypothetical protein HQ505_02005 [Nitrosopumilus sp.]|nr:hypothetical protein [Nitrosopumilus sp.]
MELSSSQKTSLVFVCVFLTAGIVLSTLVFPFWNLIREDIFEEVTILTNDDSICYAETVDMIPKTIENCILKSGDVVTIKFGEGLAWATIVGP